MKHMADMSEDERDRFKRFAIQIARETRKAGDLESYQRMPMLAMWVKTLGREGINLMVEYEVDQEGFLADAVTQAEQYMRNMLWAMENLSKTASHEEIVDYRILTEHNIEYLKGPYGRTLVELAFKKFFEHLREAD